LVINLRVCNGNQNTLRSTNNEELMRLLMIRDRGTRVCAWALVASLMGSCSSGPVDPATLRLTANTTGLNLDPDGYSYSVDGGASAALGPAETVILNGLNAGAHELAISGVASNCTLDGGTPRAIVLIPGDTTDTLLDITCQAPASPAALTLTTSTTGGDIDFDGYTFALDGDAPLPIGPNDLASITGLLPGTHQLVVGDVAANCTLAGGATRSVTLVAGGTLSVQLTVTCQSSSPTIVATVPLSGRPYGAAVSSAGVIYATQIDGSTLARGDFATRSFSSTVTVG